MLAKVREDSANKAKQATATESGAASLAYGFEKLGLDEIIARAHTANTASIRVMEKLGMTYWKDEEMDGVPGRYYRLLRVK